MIEGNHSILNTTRYLAKLNTQTMLPSPLVRNITNLILEDLLLFFFITETALTNFSFPFPTDQNT